jgi:hypothetical protein
LYYAGGGDVVMLYDRFIEYRFGAAKSDDGLVWHDITSRFIFPPDPRHAGVFTVPDDVGHALLHRWK